MKRSPFFQTRRRIISVRNTAAMLARETVSSPRRKKESRTATAVPAMPDQMLAVSNSIPGNTITASTLYGR